MIVILYVLDSLRPDFLSCYGFRRETSPNIDRIAQDGVLFRNAYATSSWTQPSAVSILTGQYPRAVGVIHIFDVLPEEVPTLPEMLKGGGFKSVCLTANHFVSEGFGLSRGFDTCIGPWRPEELLRKGRRLVRLGVGAKRIGLEETIYAESQDLNEVLLSSASYLSGPHFILIWSVDTHAPYFVRGGRSYFGNPSHIFIPADHLKWHCTRKRISLLQSLYCDMIRHNDESIGRLIEWLKGSNAYDPAMIIITSDHGEAFMEHGVYSHAGILFEEQIRVPLIVKFPKNIYAGRVVESPAQIIDIAPTILEITGCSCTQELDGVSLRDLVEGSRPERPIFCEAQQWSDTVGSASLRVGRWKWIQTWPPKDVLRRCKWLAGQFLRGLPFWRGWALYDLTEDPRERHPLMGKDIGSKLRRMTGALLSSLDKRRARLHLTRWERDEEVLRHLRSLGYM
jgi:arylsulfatase